MVGLFTLPGCNAIADTLATLDNTMWADALVPSQDDSGACQRLRGRNHTHDAGYVHGRAGMYQEA